MPAPQRPTVSVVVPVFNEARTWRRCLERLLTADFDKEVILVDDGSTDGTREELESLAHAGLESLNVSAVGRTTLHVLFQPHNQGKGAALRLGFSHASGDIVIIQDADLEYDPHQIPRVIAPIVQGDADVVFGSRFIGETRRVLYYWHAVANWWLTTLSNMATGLNLTDMETCYKAFRREVLLRMTLSESRFGIEPELTAQAARLQVRVYEVPINYFGRTYDEGKKIGWKDALRAVYVIGKQAARRALPGT